MLAICKLFSFYIHLLILRLELLNSFYAGYFLCCFFCHLIFFSRLTLKKNAFKNTISVSNSVELHLARHFVLPDLGPNCLQRLLADDCSRQRVNS